MHLSFLNPVLNYIHGDGLAVLPQMELLLFALGILIFDFLLEKKEKHWNAVLALLGVAAGAAGDPPPAAAGLPRSVRRGPWPAASPERCRTAASARR